MDQMKRYFILFSLWMMLVAPVSALTPTPSPPPQPDPPLPDPRFGIVEGFWNEEAARDLNVGFDRVIVYWSEVQRESPEEWNFFHVNEGWLADANEHGRMMMGVLKHTPEWATDGVLGAGVPRGLNLPIDDPNNLWADYTRKVAEYYGERGVHHWIVWNEPEIPEGVYGHEFSGSVEDYYRLVKVTYQSMKQADPDAVILLAGWSYWHDPTFLRRFLEVASADPEAEANGYFFDVVPLHIYFRVETVPQLINETQAILAEFGLDKPIWVNETNASPNQDPLWPITRPDFDIDLEQQSWFLVQAYALGFSAGAERMAVYKLQELFIGEGAESFGLLRPDGSERPAYMTYKTMLALLAGFETAVLTYQTDEVTVVTFTKPNGDVVRVMWARGATAVTLQLPITANTTASLITPLGQILPLAVQDGQYEVALAGARCAETECYVGGEPLFLVEDAPTPTPTVPAPVTPSASITPTPLPILVPTNTPIPIQIVATVEPTATMTPTLTPRQQVRQVAERGGSWVLWGTAVLLLLTLFWYARK